MTRASFVFCLVFASWYGNSVSGQATERTAADELKKPVYQFTSPLGHRIESQSNPPQKLIDHYLSAKSKWEQNQTDVETIIWYGRRAGYLFRLNEAIKIYSRGIELHPDEPRLYRHRGHRYISVRQFDGIRLDPRKFGS